MNTFKSYAYTPTGHMLQLSKLAEHEYFGESYVEGDATVAVFRNAKGKLYAIWSYGDWRTYGVEVGQAVDFQHTQTRRTTTLELVAILSVDDQAIEGDVDPKVVHWTLK